ncbi:MAG: response regulator [Steroidobacteraceae bacterium]
MTTRMSVLTRVLPMRILVVGDDEPQLGPMAVRLAAAGFEVERADSGEQALAMLDEQWRPVVIADWHMPAMDGIAFTEELRARGVEDTYVIVLTAQESDSDHERGYLAGVDDYLTKQMPDAELFARIHAGFNTLALRRSLQETRAELTHVNREDVESGAASVTETLKRLQSEVRRAQRYGRMLSVLTIGVRAESASVVDESTVAAPALRAVVTTLQSVVRTHVDWVGRIPSLTGGAAFVCVLPEAATPDGPPIKERVRKALAEIPAGRIAGQAVAFDFGLAGLERGGHDGKPVEAVALIDVAERCRGCQGHDGPAQLGAVQRSVAIGVTIACRHGYAVVSQCSFKSAPQLS